MTVSQKVQIVTFDQGASLSDVTLRDLLTDALVTGGTADTCDEIATDAGVYIAEFVNANSAALIPAGNYRLRAVIGGSPLNRYVTLLGVDGEVAYSTADPILDKLPTTGRAASQSSLDAAVVSIQEEIQANLSGDTVLITTTIATVTSETVLILTTGSPDSDVYNDQLAIITDAATLTQKAVSVVLDYLGSSKTLTLLSTPGFTVAAGDAISIVAVAGLSASQRAQLGLIGSGTRVTVKADSGTSITLKIGDTYSETRNTARRIEVNDGDSSIYDLLMDGDVSAIAFGLGDAAGNKDIVVGTVSPDSVTYTAASGSVSAYTTVFVELTVADTAKPVCGTYDIQVTFSDGKKKTAFSGLCELVKDNKS
jgi:hypothetical protein